MIFSQIMVFVISHGGRMPTPLSETRKSYLGYFQVTSLLKKTITWHFMYDWDILMFKCCIGIDSLAHTQSGRGLACVHPAILGWLMVFSISQQKTKLCIMLKFPGNYLEETCICISSMIMTQLHIFSVSEKPPVRAPTGGWPWLGGPMRYFISVRLVVSGLILIALVLTKKIKKRSSKSDYYCGNGGNFRINKNAIFVDDHPSQATEKPDNLSGPVFGTPWFDKYMTKKLNSYFKCVSFWFLWEINKNLVIIAIGLWVFPHQKSEFCCWT